MVTRILWNTTAAISPVNNVITLYVLRLGCEWCRHVAALLFATVVAVVITITQRLPLLQDSTSGCCSHSAVALCDRVVMSG